MKLNKIRVLKKIQFIIGLYFSWITIQLQGNLKYKENKKSRVW
jgi:hypothetical protein